MISFENVATMNFDNAIRGMRNPLSSWETSDSRYDDLGEYQIGENDMALAKTLCIAGSDHRKFMRQILVSVDIKAPLYWWKEFDTYKVGTVANSTSTMHTLHTRAFSLDDFSIEGMTESAIEHLKVTMIFLEHMRTIYTLEKDMQAWKCMIKLLPSCYMQTRTVTMNYEVLYNMYANRKNHKLDEWKDFCEFVAFLPYAQHLIVDTQKGGA